MNSIKNEFSVDLKWSLWSIEKSYWNEYQSYNSENTPEDLCLWDIMEQAFLGKSDPVTIYTAPWKEIRYGTVIISEGKANVTFYTEWDDICEQIPEDIAHDYDKCESFIKFFNFWFESSIGFMDSSPLGAWINKSITANTFKELMEKIDKEEDALIIDEYKNSAKFDNAIKLWLEKDSFRIERYMIGSKKLWRVLKKDYLIAYSVDAITGDINELEGFKTKKEAQCWIDDEFSIAGENDKTHIVWAKSIHDACNKDKDCVLYLFPEKERMNLAVISEDLSYDLFSHSTIAALKNH